MQHIHDLIMKLVAGIQVKVPVYFVVGGIGSIITSLFGGWTTGLIALLSFVAIDIITGLMVSFVFKKSAKTESGAFSSNVGWKGLCKKVVLILLVIAMHIADVVCIDTGILTTPILANWTIIAFIVNELGSIIENAGLMGIPIVEPIKKAFDILNKKVKSGEENKPDEDKAA